MNYEQAETVAAVIGGKVWASGGGVYVVVFERADGRAVALAGESVCIYANAEQLQADGQPEQIIRFA